MQYNQEFDTDKVMGAEDCLYLNIYVPMREKTTNETSMPVLFWIHGGAFQFGSGMVYGAKYLMDHDVVFVTINYRLGPMGKWSELRLQVELSKITIARYSKIISIFK